MRHLVNVVTGSLIGITAGVMLSNTPQGRRVMKHFKCKGSHLVRKLEHMLR